MSLNYFSLNELEKFIESELRSLTVIISLTRQAPEIINNERSCYIKAHYHLPLYDHEHENFISTFKDMCIIIDRHINDDINVIIHCECGISRSPTLVIAYMIYNERITYDQAIDQLNDLMVSINDGFVCQLKLWEQHILSGEVLVINDDDYIDNIPALKILFNND